MRRLASRKTQVGISLFPFLAVLICTMGSLIVLLLLVVQQARVQADTVADQRRQQSGQDQSEQKKLAQEAEDWQWQREILEQQRSQMTEKLADSRLELSHLEEHIRRLEQNWRRMQAEVEELNRLQPGTPQDASAQEELARLQAEIAAQRKQLEELREQYAQQRRSFAIVPYQGPNGTHRRPIYIECRQSGITIQPEGITFGPQDFTGPLGPGNPLDAALRAIREHWTRLEGDAAQGEPYPLLIVRPDGAVAYSMARAAMAGWDDEFGYELVDDEMELAFPPGDPSLNRLLQSTIQTARERQAILAAAMPSRFDAPSPASFSVPQGEAWGGMDENPRSGSASGRMAGGSALGSGKSTQSATGYGGGGTSRPPSGEPETADSSASRPPGTAATAAGKAPSARAGNPPAQAGPPQGRGGDATAGASSPGQAGGAALPSMALTKGANWALPDSTASATGITRPITVHCYPDRLVVLPDRRDARDPQAVPLDGATRDSMEAFVSAIWTHMERWGMAVAGGYWKPTLKVTVFPGAETRFWELQALLAGSGIDVERR
jgi:archaellum component FlaC